MRAPEWLIVVGATVFVAVLALSAEFDPTIRWLHFFQSWMYLATIALALRHNRWGYFIGISAAGLWDLINLVATTFFVNGLHALSHLLQTGKVVQASQLIAVPAWLSNVLVVIGCGWACTSLRGKSVADVGRFLLAFALTTSFFAMAVVLFQPRYLPLFTRLVHPAQWVIWNR